MFTFLFHVASLAHKCFRRTLKPRVQFFGFQRRLKKDKKMFFYKLFKNSVAVGQEKHWSYAGNQLALPLPKGVLHASYDWQGFILFIRSRCDSNKASSELMKRKCFSLFGLAIRKSLASFASNFPFVFFIIFISFGNFRQFNKLQPTIIKCQNF